MNKIVSALVLCVAMAMPAAAQDDPTEKFNDLFQKIEERVQQAINDIMTDVQDWMQDFDHGQFFDDFEFDGQNPGMPGMPGMEELLEQFKDLFEQFRESVPGPGQKPKGRRLI